MHFAGRLLLIWLLVILGGVLFQIGYLRWWAAILVTPLPFGLAFALCRSRIGCLLFGLFGGFLALRIHQDVLTAYSEIAANFLIFLNALTLVPVAYALHQGAHRGYRMAWVLPLAWVGAETLRMIGPLGMPFTILGFACYEQVGLIQVADLGGPLLLSFAIAAANGVALDLILARSAAGRGFHHALLPGGLAVAVAWVSMGVYGQVRIRQVEEAMMPGPRIAVVQSDAILFQDPAKHYDGQVLLQELMAMSEEAATERPDLIVWPEHTADIPIHNSEFLQAEFDLRMVPPESRAEAEAGPAPFIEKWENYRKERLEEQAAFLAWVDTLAVPVLAGLIHQAPGDGEFPRYFDKRNAATLLLPGAQQASTSQFKMRLFPGGEYLPGNQDVWLRWLGWLPVARSWIESVGEFQKGRERVVMDLDGHPFVVSICSEILHSDSAGVFAPWPDGRQPLIVSLSNEGRFHRNRALLVSQMAMAFRAVEARTTVARAANAGISGFADPAGRYQGLVTSRDGRRLTGLGAPDAAAIEAVLAFLDEHGTETIARDTVLRAEYQRLLGEVERLRALAGIRGYSIRETSTTTLHTLYQRGGRHFPKAVLVSFAIFLGSTMIPGLYKT